MSRCVVGGFMGHLRDVPSGDLWACAASVLVEGRSQREVAREFGLSRKTIQKMLRYAVPQRPKLGPWLGVIDAILEDDRQRPVKQ